MRTTRPSVSSKLQLYAHLSFQLDFSPTFARLLIALMAYVGLQAGRGGWYFGGLAVAASLAVFHQYLIRDRNPTACFEAFLNNNYFGMAIFVGLVLDYAVG